MVTRASPSDCLLLSARFTSAAATRSREEAFRAADKLALPEEALLEAFRSEGLRPPEGVHKGWFGELPESEFPATIALAFFDGDMCAERQSEHSVPPANTPYP